MSPLVQTRVATTLGWFGYGLGATAATVYAVRNNYRLAMLSPWVILPASILMAIGTYATDYDRAKPLKILLYTGFCGVMAVNMLPLIQISTLSVISDAALATAVSMSAFAAVAYNSPSEQFLKWGGAIALLSGGMLAVSLLGMFTGSRNLFNIWLYGGLALSGIYTMYDTQKIIYNAKH
jgi:FtsH-binding integral membrane protein